ncbi:prephenate dehydrogenase [Companilactobacillus jidongensis]|uniref:prephenate dehydrogenase n=1 Tax=Companilactobacillus jidongensis TaxID=2486006 RepID=UPI001CDBF5BF|nr:prephenate dehydrogenase/arogenate dehydrogenase family protein [Companilactobacillus jidongensis]
MRTIIVVGLGAMGASIAEELRTSNSKVLGIDSNRQTCKIALEERVVDEMISWDSPVVKDSDLIILAGPIKMIKKYLQLLQYMNLSNKTIVTDIGSTKYEIMELAKGLPNFVGGHPMIGTDKRGIRNRNKDMFVDKPFFLVGEIQKIKLLSNLLEPLHSKIQAISAIEHDKLVTSISDLPHVAAFALVNSIDNGLPNNQLNWQENVAGGFIDTTRIAQSNPEMWSQILLSNRDSVVDGIDQLIITLQSYKQNLIESNITKLTGEITVAQRIRQEVGELHE